jgi:predicted  nucleic acid-binding Zn-ribbon protein
LEERELEAMLVAETTEKELLAAKSDLEQIQASINEQNRDLSKENEALEKDLEQLEHERQAILSDLAAPAVTTYDQIRKQRRGIAVTIISDSACAACGTTLTLSLQQSARSANQLFTCPTCGRILYA